MLLVRSGDIIRFEGFGDGGSELHFTVGSYSCTLHYLQAVNSCCIGGIKCYY